MKKPIKDVKIGDKVMGTDGKWHKVIDKTETKLPFKMYKITFSNGSVFSWDLYKIPFLSTSNNENISIKPIKTFITS